MGTCMMQDVDGYIAGEEECGQWLGLKCKYTRGCWP